MDLRISPALAGALVLCARLATAQAPLTDLPVPVPPETEARDDKGHVTVRAARAPAPMRVDGRLDEAVYRERRPITGMIQSEPNAGTAFTEKTDAWVLFDDEAVYVSIRCWDSHPERAVLNEMRRDHGGIAQNDHVSFTLDTFYDHRNAVSFTVSGSGGRMDGQFTDERFYNGDWNPVWDSAVAKFEGGWSVEMKVPFKSLRYRPGRDLFWGFNIRRFSRWKNEMGHLTPIPRSLSARGMFMQSLAATLVGIEAPPAGLNLEVKPYLTGSLTSDRLVRPPVARDMTGDAGVDVKARLGQGLTADVTVNTDFAQVEADEQQVNLTRFSLFFPEKRDFFLENSGTFAYGGASGGGDTPTLFYSRRIGLNLGRSVPITAGGRVTGRVGRFTVGAINIQTGDESTSGTPSTNFSVLRLKRDILRKSAVGVLATHRSRGELRPGSNDAIGADATFGFFDNLTLNTYWARTRTEGRTNEDVSYRGQLDYAGDRYGVQVEHLAVGANFNPDIGFVRRADVRRSFASARFSPRPKKARVIRKYSYVVSGDYISNRAGRVEARDLDASFGIEFQKGDRLNLVYAGNYEFLPAPFRIAPTVVLPVGGYAYANGRIAYTFGEQRKTSGTASVEYGSFYSGTRTTYGVTSGRMEISRQFSVQPSFSVNRIALAQGNFTTTLIGSRVTYTMTPLMFASALIQYNSSGRVLSSNVRLRWEYAPGSELFVVYNDQRDTLAPGWPGLQNRAVIVKVNRLFRF